MKKRIIIEGMSCQHCVRHVKDALSEINGVTNIDVSLENKNAILEASGDVSDEVIKEAVEEVGYEVLGIEAL